MSIAPLDTHATSGADDVRAAGAPPSQDMVRCAPLAELLFASSSGDVEAFAELYDQTCARVYGVVLRVLREACQAADVVEDVYLELWRTAPSYDPGRGSVLAWMTTVAHRRAVDRVQSLMRRLPPNRLYPPETELCRFTPVWGRIAQNFTSERVRLALGALSALQRDVVVLTYVGGHTGTQVADLLNWAAREAHRAEPTEKPASAAVLPRSAIDEAAPRTPSSSPSDALR